MRLSEWLPSVSRGGEPVSELRWILLGAGVALILGLWWWETRKARPTGDPTETWPRLRAEPSVDGQAHAGDPARVASPPFKPTIERLRAQRRPPLIEISDDLEVDISAYVGKDRRRVPEPEPIDIKAADALQQADGGAEPAPRREADADHRAPWVRTHPLERSEVAPRREAVPEEPHAMDSIEQHAAEASKQ